MFMFPCLLLLPTFIFSCSLAFMFGCTFAFAFVGLATGLGDAVTVVFELALVLLFEFSAVLQAAPKTTITTKMKKPVVRRISVPPMCNKSSNEQGAKFRFISHRIHHGST